MQAPEKERAGNSAAIISPKQHRAAAYIKVLDKRKQPIRGLWVRNGRYYAQFTVEDTHVTPIALNHDFFAGLLGGDVKLNHSVIYYEPEMQFYYREPVQNIYKPTTAEKLQNYYRAMLLRCAQELNGETDKLNLFAEFRSDKNARAVTNRAKSILAADHTFFSATSPHQRIKGPELHERLMRNLVETMLESRAEACLTVTQAYDVFCRLAEQRQLSPLKRSLFRENMRDLVRERYGLALRNDVPDTENRHQQAWRGLAVVGSEALAA
jgi:hypothetical protein